MVNSNEQANVNSVAQHQGEPKLLADNIMQDSRVANCVNNQNDMQRHSPALNELQSFNKLPKNIIMEML